MNYFSFKISQPNAIKTVKAVFDEREYIEIQQLNQLEDSLIENSLIFIMLGGDKVEWEKGLAGLAQIVREPFDKGYDNENKRNFKLGIRMLFSLKTPIKREEFIYYLNSYDAGGIGPATKGEQNQAIKALTEVQAITIVRAMLDRDERILTMLGSVFTEEIIAKIVGNIPMLQKCEKEYASNSIRLTRNKRGENVLFYGVPGSGKSHTIGQIINGESYERVVFHPDYTYSDFVGQIMPKLEKSETGEGKLTYKFVSGPFTKIMKEANKAENKDKMFYLVIEEINRGNAPAIFGDIFQLLDRKENGEGKYHITNFDIAREVYGNEDAEVRIPSNLSILATMNTSDQNVFTLDTAFQRRWNMKYIDNDVNAAKHADINIEGSSVTWGQFANIINDEILEANAEMLSAEDKQLGAYFVEKDELSADKFPEKALKYLWDDAFKMERDKIFDPNIKSIWNLVTAYTDEVNSGKDPIARVMKEDVYKRMMDLSAKTVKEAFEDDEVFEARKDD